MINSRVAKQHQSRVEQILERRKDPAYVEPKTRHTGSTPSKQADEQAKRILARRGVNDIMENVEVIKPVHIDLTLLQKKDLKLICDERKIEYKTKATVKELIALLEGN